MSHVAFFQSVHLVNLDLTARFPALIGVLVLVLVIIVTGLEGVQQDVKRAGVNGLFVNLVSIIYVFQLRK